MWAIKNDELCHFGIKGMKWRHRKSTRSELESTARMYERSVMAKQNARSDYNNYAYIRDKSRATKQKMYELRDKDRNSIGSKARKAKNAIKSFLRNGPTKTTSGRISGTKVAGDPKKTTGYGGTTKVKSNVKGTVVASTYKDKYGLPAYKSTKYIPKKKKR